MRATLPTCGRQSCGCSTRRAILRVGSLPQSLGPRVFRTECGQDFFPACTSSFPTDTSNLSTLVRSRRDRGQQTSIANSDAAPRPRHRSARGRGCYAALRARGVQTDRAANDRRGTRSCPRFWLRSGLRSREEVKSSTVQQERCAQTIAAPSGTSQRRACVLLCTHGGPESSQSVGSETTESAMTTRLTMRCHSRRRT